MAQICLPGTRKMLGEFRPSSSLMKSELEEDEVDGTREEAVTMTPSHPRPPLVFPDLMVVGEEGLVRT